MIMNDNNTLGTIEETQIRAAAYAVFSSCPFIPEYVSTQYGDMEKSSIGMFSQQGSGRYTKRYVSGTYEAQYPFFLRYRVMPTTDANRMNAEELLESVAQWMSGTPVVVKGETYQIGEYPALTDKRTIEKIEASNVFMVSKEQDGTVDYQVQMNLKYSKKGR